MSVKCYYSSSFVSSTLMLWPGRSMQHGARGNYSEVPQAIDGYVLRTVKHSLWTSVFYWFVYLQYLSILLILTMLAPNGSSRVNMWRLEFITHARKLIVRKFGQLNAQHVGYFGLPAVIVTETWRWGPNIWQDGHNRSLPPCYRSVSYQHSSSSVNAVAR